MASREYVIRIGTDVYLAQGNIRATALSHALRQHQRATGQVPVFVSRNYESGGPIEFADGSRTHFTIRPARDDEVQELSAKDQARERRDDRPGRPR